MNYDNNTPLLPSSSCMPTPSEPADYTFYVVVAVVIILSVFLCIYCTSLCCKKSRVGDGSARPDVERQIVAHDVEGPMVARVDEVIPIFPPFI